MKVTNGDVKPGKDEIPTDTLYDIDKGNLCLLCGKYFRKLSFLYRHLEQHGIKNLCRQCGKSYLNEDSYEEHVLTHNNHNTCTCSHCGKVFKRKEDLKVHTRSHIGVKPYGCNLCTKRFVQDSQLKRHQLVHKNEHPFSCAQCSKSFRTKGNLEIHTRIHSGIKPYTCVECKKSFSDPSAFNRHKIIHSGLKPYKCKKCPSAFADNGSLSRHKVLHGTEYPFSCGHCNKTFRTKAYLIKHIVCHDSKNTFTCKICHKKYASRNNLYVHSRIHYNQEFRCNFCNKNFTTERYLKRHITIHTEPIKKFQCDICDRKFCRLLYLGTHIETEHLSDKPFPCDQCSETFTCKTKLKNHMSYHGERFTCKICGKYYSSYFNLCGHLQIHKNEKFICDYCNKIFVTKSHLRRHIYTHTRPIQCDLCNKRFALLPRLAVHLRSEHPLRQYKKGQIDTNAQTPSVDRDPIPDSSINHSEKSKKLKNKRETKGLQGKELEIDINTTQKKTFDCNYGAIQFPRKSDLNKHLLSHNTSSGYTIFKHPQLYLRVNSNKQDMDETEPCISGMRSQIDSQTYKESDKKKVRYTFHKCNKKFSSKRDLKKHYLVHSASKDKEDLRSGNARRRRQANEIVLEKARNDSNRDTYSKFSLNSLITFPGQQVLEQLSVESLHDSNQRSNCISEIDREPSSRTNVPQIVNDRQSLLMESCSTAQSASECLAQFSSESEFHDHDELCIRDESDVSKSVRGPNCVATCPNKKPQSPIDGSNKVINSNISESVVCSAVVIIEDSLPERYYCSLCTNEFNLESELNKHLETHSESDIDVPTVNGGSEDIYCNDGIRDNNEDISNNEISFSLRIKHRRITEDQTSNNPANISSNSSRDISNSDRIYDPLQRQFDEETSSADEPNSVDLHDSNFDNLSAITTNGKQSMLKSILLNKVKDKFCTESYVRDFDLISKTSQSANDEESSSADRRGSVEVHNINIDNSYSVTVIANDCTVKSISCDVIEDKLCTNGTDNSGRSTSRNEGAGFPERVRRKQIRINYKDLENGALMNMIDIPCRSSKIRKKHIFSVSGRSIQH